MKAHGAKVKIKRTTNEKEVGRKEVFEVLEVCEVNHKQQTINTKRQTTNNKQQIINIYYFYLLLHP
jgi:hypothetical protein